MRALINAYIIHVTLGVLVFLKGWHTFDKKKWARIILIILFGLEFLIYTYGFFFYRTLPDNVVQLIRVMGTSWMLFLLYTGGLWFITDLIYIFVRRLLKKPWYLNRQSRKFRIISLTIPILFVTGVMINGHYKFNNPVVQELRLNIEKPVEEFDSVRIAVIGDMHLGWMINRKHAKRYVDLIMSQKPDLILFVGDIIDSHIEPILDQDIKDELVRLSAPLGIYSCTGNHEYRYDAEEKIQLLNESGIVMLRDSVVLIDSAIYVVGRDDKVILDRKSTEEIISENHVDMSKPVIILNHTPDNLSEESEARADLALYGHTHHGQAFPGNIATEIVFEVAHGYKKKENTHVYVTSGIGLVGPQFRIGTVSEIAIITILFRN